MGIVAHEHGPVLRGIWIFFDLLCYDFAKARVFGEPFSGRACDRMPSNFDGAGRSVENWGCDGDNIGLMAQADGMFQRNLSLSKLFLS